MKGKFYITTPIYYVNDQPHIGHAYTTVAADILARFHRISKDKTFFLTGTDEHGLKIQRKAEEAGKNPQEFVDEISNKFKELWGKLGIKYDNFIRTTDEKHKKAVQKVSQTLYDKGVIYEGEYEGLYCVGCEQFKSESDLVDGKCPDHNIKVELLKEECYLLKLTEIQPILIEKIKSGKFKITPEKYKNEILSFLENQKLRDISVSRKNIKWGIPSPSPAPDEPDKEPQVMYVWFDAFLNYLTGLGWDGDEKNIPEMWPADVHLIGKDILRVHATIWPAILIHLGIELPKMLFVHGHILSGGKKMSKTLGNVIKIESMIEKFGVDATRYLLLSMGGNFGEDFDVTWEKMTEKYNADLANGIGNLTSRVIKLAQSNNFKFEILNFKSNLNDKFSNLINNLELNQALEYIWKIIREDDKYVEDNKPWELAKNNPEKFEEVMQKLASNLYLISELLIPFMPETSEKIRKALNTKETNILFRRINTK
jgi:methionyl-tRNA synthetase